MAKSKSERERLASLGALDVCGGADYVPYSAPGFSDGKNLSKLRKELGVTQTQLADAVSVEQAYISQIESGERRLDGHIKADIWRAMEVFNGEWIERKNAEHKKNLERLRQQDERAAIAASIQREADRLSALQASGALPKLDTGGVTPFSTLENLFTPPSSPITNYEKLLGVCENQLARLREAKVTIAMLVNLLNIETKKLLTEEELAKARQEITERMRTLHPDLCEEIQRKREENE